MHIPLLCRYLVHYRHVCHAESEEEERPVKRGRGRVRDAGGSRARRGRGGRGLGSRGRGRGATAAAASSTQPAAVADNWTTVDESPREHPFQGDPGVKATLPSWTEPYTIFRLFFTSALLQLIVDETNRYAAEMAPKTKTVWSAVSEDDVMCFIALMLLMGIVRKPSMSLYWATDATTSTPYFGVIMSRNRFLAINQFFHFANNSLNPGNDRIFKIRPVIEHLREKFRTTFFPDRSISIDESLLLWKGRLGWKQYIPKKRSRFGIKTYELCDSKTGYLWNFIVYTGKSVVDTVSDLSVSSQVVIDLMAGLLDKGYCVVTDNFYTCPALYTKLLGHKTDAYGTVRLGRQGMPPALKKTKLKKLECKFMRSDRLLALTWYDKRPVSMLSTIHDASFISTGKTDKKTGEEIRKPKVIVDYNTFMGGVDKLDQMIEPYLSIRKSLKWYKKFFQHLLDVTVYNSFVLFKIKNASSKSSLLDFRKDLISNIITRHHSGQRRMGGRPSGSGDAPSRLSERHFPVFIPPSGSQQNPLRECRVCGASKQDGKRIRKQTRYMCGSCGGVALCVVPCFQRYHTLVHYEHDAQDADSD